MADGYEIFDTGHGSINRTHYRLNAKEIDQVMRAVRALRLSSAAEARQMMLLRGSGRNVQTVPELYDVELGRVLDYLERQRRIRRAAGQRAGCKH